MLHSIIVPFSLSTKGLIKSAFRYPLEPFSPVDTFIPTFPGNSTPSFSYILIKFSFVISLQK